MEQTRCVVGLRRYALPMHKLRLWHHWLANAARDLNTDQQETNCRNIRLKKWLITKSFRDSLHAQNLINHAAWCHSMLSGNLCIAYLFETASRCKLLYMIHTASQFFKDLFNMIWTFMTYLYGAWHSLLLGQKRDG